MPGKNFISFLQI